MYKSQILCNSHFQTLNEGTIANFSALYTQCEVLHNVNNLVGELKMLMNYRTIMMLYMYRYN